MLPKLGPEPDWSLPPSWTRKTSNFEHELAPWFRLALPRSHWLTGTGGVEPGWEDEPPSARIPFLIF